MEKKIEKSTKVFLTKEQFKIIENNCKTENRSFKNFIETLVKEKIKEIELKN